jgi:DNA-binding CsgD family transcriptional regulator
LRRRRGRDIRSSELLVERDNERALIERRLAEAQDGSGSVIVIEGPAGTGKSRLLQVAGDLARELGFDVLGAFGTELERHFPFGVAIQLFEPWWLGAAAHRRPGGAGEATTAVASLLRDGPGAAESDAGYATVHGLFRLAARLASEGEDGAGTGTLAILVDDVQWADGPSLRFLAYTAARIAELPIALVVAMRPGEPGADAQGLAALRVAAGGSLARLASLSAGAVQTIVAAEFPDATDAFCAGCHRTTDGNPFLLLELLEQVRADGLPPDESTTDRLGELAPEAVLDSVVARLGTMPGGMRSVALAVAILGDGASLRHVTALTGLSAKDAAQAGDALAQMHLFAPGEPLSFVHPLVRRAVERSISPLDSGHGHARAAAVLDQDGQTAEVIAPHLLAAPAQVDPRAVVILRAAARNALANGAAPSAVAMLRRALAEGSRDAHADLLGELAQAEVSAGLPQATARLSEAIAVCDQRGRRAELELTLGAARYREGAYGEAVTVLAGALLDAAEDPVLSEEIVAAQIAAASLVPALAPETQRRGDRLLASLAGAPSPAQRAALAHLAVHQALRGESGAAVLRLAEMAWGAGELLDADAALGPSWPMVAAALLMVDELEWGLELGDAALRHADARKSPAALAMAQQARAWPLYERGEIAAASAAARAAIDALPSSGHGHFRTAYGAIACCHLQQGHLAEAEGALAVIGRPELHRPDQLPSLLIARAQLRMAQGRGDEAVSDATEAGRQWEEHVGSDNPGSLAWRSIAALAHLARGETGRAHELATEELARAREMAVTRIVIRDLRILGLITGGEDGLALLAEAVRLGAEAPARLEHIAALIAFGGALRRSNQRAAARGPLKEAVRRAQRGGAIALAEAAQGELVVAGSRPRTTSHWGPDALTPSELRVAELAAGGLTTRKMAESLFVTPKTIEYHLRHIYQKLGVNSRDKLGEALRGEE